MVKEAHPVSAPIEERLADARHAGQAALVLVLDDRDTRLATLTGDIEQCCHHLGDRTLVILIAATTPRRSLVLPENCVWADAESATRLVDDHGQPTAVYFDPQGTCRRRIYTPTTVCHRVSTLIRPSASYRETDALDLGDILT